MLGIYREEVRDLLRDDFSQFFSIQKVDNYINRARRQVALQTGCIRVLVAGASAAGSDATVGNSTAGSIIPGAIGNANNQTLSIFNTIPGQERYPYSFANPLAQQQNGGVKAIFEVYGVACSWGGTRPAMAYMPWLDFQAYARATTNGTIAYPLIWTKYQDGENGQVWLFPVPSIEAEMEWDCGCLPINLVDDNTIDAIPTPYQNAIKYYAAELAYLSSQRFGMADIMEEHFQRNLQTDTAATQSGAIPDFYYSDDGY